MEGLGSPVCVFFLPCWRQPVEAQAMHLSSKSGVVLAPASRGPDACQMATRAQLGQDPPQRTVLGVLTENVQYRSGQVTALGSCWRRRALLSRREVGFACSSTYKLPWGIPALGPGLLGHSGFRSSCWVPFPARNSEYVFLPNRSRNCLDEAKRKCECPQINYRAGSEPGADHSKPVLDSLCGVDWGELPIQMGQARLDYFQK